MPVGGVAYVLGWQLVMVVLGKHFTVFVSLIVVERLKSNHE